MTFVGVAGRDDRDAMADFVARHGLDGFVHLVDEDGTLWRRFGVTSQPSWAFVDDAGAIDVRFGGLGVDGLLARVDDLTAA